VGIAVSDNPAGPFKYVKSFRPLGHESRDIGQFIDDDGAAYLGDLYGRYLEAKDAMGVCLFMDAGGDRGWEAVPS